MTNGIEYRRYTFVFWTWGKSVFIAIVLNGTCTSYIFSSKDIFWYTCLFIHTHAWQRQMKDEYLASHFQSLGRIVFLGNMYYALCQFWAVSVSNIRMTHSVCFLTNSVNSFMVDFIFWSLLLLWIVREQKQMLPVTIQRNGGQLIFLLQLIQMRRLCSTTTSTRVTIPKEKGVLKSWR